MLALIPQAAAAHESSEMVWQGFQENRLVYVQDRPSDYQLVVTALVVVFLWEIVKGIVGHCASWCRKKKPAPRQLPAREASSSSSDSDDPPPTAAAGPRERRPRPSALNRASQPLRKVVFTQNGKCVHASRQCSTLNVSQEFQERNLCTVCCRIK